MSTRSIVCVLAVLILNTYFVGWLSDNNVLVLRTLFLRLSVVAIRHYQRQVEIAAIHPRIWTWFDVLWSALLASIVSSGVFLPGSGVLQVLGDMCRVIFLYSVDDVIYDDCTYSVLLWDAMLIHVYH
jgi:hypothetical protein